MIANAFFLPRHLLPSAAAAGEAIPQLEAATDGVSVDTSDELADE
jgi:hypothetical protein